MADDTDIHPTEAELTLRAQFASTGHTMDDTLADHLGVRFLEADARRLVATMPVAGNTQPYGLLHGGASAALAETLGSVGAALHAGPGRRVVGTDLNATHHRAATSGHVTGTATAVHLGRTTASYEIVITDEADRRVCTARLTCLILDS